MHSEQFLYLTSSISATLINGMQNQVPMPGRMLLVKLDEIGDMLYTIHVIKALREKWADSELVLYCKPICRNLVEDIGLDSIVHDDSVFEEDFDIQIDFRGNLNSLHHALLGNCRYYLDRGTVRLANKWSGGQAHERHTNWKIAEKVLQGASYREPELRVHTTDEQVVLDLIRAAGCEGFVLMHCGANDEIRRWPARRFTELADRLHRDFGLHAILCGGPDDSILNRSVMAERPYIRDFSGKTTLMQLHVLCKKAALFIGNESGPLHVATLAGVPLIAMFGPGVKNVFYPYGNQVRIFHPMTMPISQRMDRISVDEVYHACRELLNGQHPGPNRVS